MICSILFREWTDLSVIFMGTSDPLWRWHMRRRLRKLIVVPILAIGLLVGSAAAASASDAFLCPVVGQGVLHAPGRADAVITPPVGTSFLPGNNQAGAHANPNAWNTDGPGNPDAGPGGGNSDFSPIWPAS